MSSTVLVIDSNATVQAICALALGQTGCTVEQLADGSQAHEKVLAHKPSVVLVNKDSAGVDPFQFAERVRQQISGISLVLLAPMEQSPPIIEKARAAGFREVLFKPFKSNKIRETVTRLLEESIEIETEGPEVLLAIASPLLAKIVEKLVSKRGALVTYRSDDSPIRHSLTATIATWTQSEALGWHDPATMGSLILLVRPVDHNQAALAFPHARLLHLPLTYESFAQALDPLLPKRPSATGQDTRELESGEVAVLAARISATIFERLLIQPAFRSRNFEDVAQVIREDVLRMTREYTK